MSRAFIGQKHPETGEELHGETWTTCKCDYHDGIKGCASGNRVIMMRLRNRISGHERNERARLGLDE